MLSQGKMAPQSGTVHDRCVCITGVLSDFAPGALHTGGELQLQWPTFKTTAGKWVHVTIPQQLLGSPSPWLGQCSAGCDLTCLAPSASRSSLADRKSCLRSASLQAAMHGEGVTLAVTGLQGHLAGL